VTRVLYWNIENFGINKIYNPNTRKRKSGSSLKENEAAQDRLAEISTVLLAANPQVIVIVEVESSPFYGAGLLAIGAGVLGAAALRVVVQNVLGGNWALVPPLQTGPTEAVGVLYETTNRFFAGPFVWPGGGGPSVAPGAATGAYPPAWTTMLPAAAVPAGALQNVGVAQNLCAARAAYTYRAAHHTNAGAAYNFAAFERAPYMVSLFESAPVARTLTIFGIHAPAGGGAAAYLQNLAELAEIVDNIAANEIRLVIGDFNVQLLTAALAEDPAYGHLQARGYTLALRPLNPAPAPPVAGYPAYYATHIRGQFNAACWPTGGVATNYPGYRYVGGDHGPPSQAIDNAFFQYGAGLVPPGATNFTIMNRVVGTPLNAVAPPSGGAPPGTVALARGTTIPPPAIPPAVGPPYNPGLMTSFQSWDEYGHIRSTSDHFALVLDV